MDQALNSQKTPHTSPLRASYGMSFVSILMKNDRVIKGFYCNMFGAVDEPLASIWVKCRGIFYWFLACIYFLMHKYWQWFSLSNIFYIFFLYVRPFVLSYSIDVVSTLSNDNKSETFVTIENVFSAWDSIWRGSNWTTQRSMTNFICIIYNM